MTSPPMAASRRRRAGRRTCGASGARSPDAPTEPLRRDVPARRRRRSSVSSMSISRGRARPRSRAPGRRPSAPASAARPSSGSGSPTPTAVRAGSGCAAARPAGPGAMRLFGELAEAGVDAVDGRAGREAGRRCVAARARRRPRRRTPRPDADACQRGCRRSGRPRMSAQSDGVGAGDGPPACISGAPGIGRSRPCSRRGVDGDVVARVGVAHDAGAGVVPQHALEPLRPPRRAVARR